MNDHDFLIKFIENNKKELTKLSSIDLCNLFYLILKNPTWDQLTRGQADQFTSELIEIDDYKYSVPKSFLSMMSVSPLLSSENQDVEKLNNLDFKIVDSNGKDINMFEYIQLKDLVECKIEKA